MYHRTKVLFLITDLPRDGAQRQLLELVKGLDKERFQLIVLTLNPGGPLEQEFRRIRGVRLLSLARKGKYDFLCFLKVFRILRRMKVDIVQPFLTPATLFGLLPALICRTPVKIVTERNGPQMRTNAGYRLYLKAEDMLSRSADWAVANSLAGREFLIQRGIEPSRVKVIYNGINISRLNPDHQGVERVRQKIGVPQGGKVVGMMARMFPPKNHALFLQTAALIGRVAPQTRFALLGDGPLRAHLEELSRKLGLDSEMVFLGEQQDVGTYLSAFDIAVLTSDTEGCSNSLLEAMALGIPVIATNVGGNREVVRDGESGLLVPSGNAEALAKAIITLLENPKLAKSMGEQARQRAITEFSLERMVNQYQSLYQETLAEKVSRRKLSRAIRGITPLSKRSQQEHYESSHNHCQE
jgi:glycosyltransferase involved in cell wall biosynthesis